MNEISKKLILNAANEAVEFTLVFMGPLSLEERLHLFQKIKKQFCMDCGDRKPDGSRCWCDFND